MSISGYIQSLKNRQGHVRRVAFSQPVLLILLVAILTRCNKTYEYPYSDGLYCAEVDYSHPATHDSYSYLLQVTIREKKLIRVNLPNGNNLFNDNFTLNGFGNNLVYYKSPKGIKYSVRIIADFKECQFSLDAPNEITFIEEEEKKVCPICSKPKISEKEFCISCEYQVSNTCPRCETFEKGLNGNLCRACVKSE